MRCTPKRKQESILICFSQYRTVEGIINAYLKVNRRIIQENQKGVLNAENTYLAKFEEKIFKTIVNGTITIE